jgi:thiamine-phosphate pyrophosphorylase
MGGIKANNIDQVLSAGASIAAVVTAVTAAPDVSAAAAELRKKILQYRA